MCCLLLLCQCGCRQVSREVWWPVPAQNNERVAALQVCESSEVGIADGRVLGFSATMVIVQSNGLLQTQIPVRCDGYGFINGPLWYGWNDDGSMVALADLGGCRVYEVQGMTEVFRDKSVVSFRWSGRTEGVVVTSSGTVSSICVETGLRTNLMSIGSSSTPMFPYGCNVLSPDAAFAFATEKGNCGVWDIAGRRRIPCAVSGYERASCFWDRKSTVALVKDGARLSMVDLEKQTVVVITNIADGMEAGYDLSTTGEVVARGGQWMVVSGIQSEEGSGYGKRRFFLYDLLNRKRSTELTDTHGQADVAEALVDPQGEKVAIFRGERTYVWKGVLEIVRISRGPSGGLSVSATSEVWRGQCWTWCWGTSGDQLLVLEGKDDVRIMTIPTDNVDERHPEGVGVTTSHHRE